MITMLCIFRNNAERWCERILWEGEKNFELKNGSEYIDGNIPLVVK